MSVDLKGLQYCTVLQKLYTLRDEPKHHKKPIDRYNLFFVL